MDDGEVLLYIRSLNEEIFSLVEVNKENQAVLNMLATLPYKTFEEFNLECEEIFSSTPFDATVIHPLFARINCNKNETYATNVARVLKFDPSNKPMLDFISSATWTCLEFNLNKISTIAPEATKKRYDQSPSSDISPIGAGSWVENISKYRQ